MAKKKAKKTAGAAPKQPSSQTLLPATFDPLDAPIIDAYNYHQSLPDNVRAGLYIRWYWADPTHWTRHKPPAWVFGLKWSTFRYSEVTDRKTLRQHLREDDPGVYFFTVRPSELLDHIFLTMSSTWVSQMKMVRDVH